MKTFQRYLAGILAAFVGWFACISGALAAPVMLSLDESIALALTNNPAIKIANSGRDEAYWAVKQAQSNKGLSIDYTHSDLRSKSYNSRLLTLYGIKQYQVTNTFENEVTLSLPVYSGGKLERQIDNAKQNLTIADLTIAAAKQELIQNVTSYYYNVLQYGHELRVSQETVDNYTKHLKNVQLQYEVGTVAKSDVLASEVSLANAQNTLIKARNNYELAMATLNNAIGLPLDSELKLEDQIEREPLSLTLEECAQYALANRPEIAQYRAKLAIAKNDIKIAKSGYRPTVSLAASQDWYDSEFPGDKNSNWYVGLTASMSLFDSGLNASKVKQAEAGLSTTQEEARQQQDAILLEVRQYYLNMREAEKRIQTSKVALDEAEENLRIAELRYSAGAGTNLDVLDAVLSLDETKINVIQAKYNYHTSKAQLVKAMGMQIFQQ